MNHHLFLLIPFISWVFSIALLLHLIKNIRLKKYVSGAVTGYIINACANGILGYYLYFQGEKIIAYHQFTACMLCIFIIIQSVVFEHGK